MANFSSEGGVIQNVMPENKETNRDNGFISEGHWNQLQGAVTGKRLGSVGFRANSNYSSSHSQLIRAMTS